VWAGAAVVGALLPSECRDDTIASAIAWAGLPAIALIGIDLVRRTRMALGLLFTWALLFWLGTWGTASGDWGDCDQLIGVVLWATLPAGVVVLLGSFCYPMWWIVKASQEPHARTRPRRWRAEVEGSSLVITRRKPPLDQ
jgi:hypothetical protein